MRAVMKGEVVMCKFVRLVLFVISVSVCPSLLFASDSLSELCYGFERVRHNAVYSYKGGNVLKIIQVANNSGLILVTVRHSPFGITPKVFALQTNLEGLVDDGEVPVGYYAHEGPYQYQNALGARRTVDSFRMLSESERDAYVEQRNKDAERVRKEEEK